MGKLGFYFNGTRCIGCRACQIACKDKNDLAVGVVYRQVRTYETGVFPKPGYYHHSSTCNHCMDPACVMKCPSGAMHVANNGTVQIDVELCIGCKSCVGACPYGVPQYLEKQEIAGKCNMCVDLWTKEELPVCVEACPQRVLEWGDIDKLFEKHPDAVRDLPILPDSSQTGPSTLILPRACALETDFCQKFI
jgi:anaerobic dimethyl sulfoxide reductase subunit B (iron-sulfur subunit)